MAIYEYQHIEGECAIGRVFEVEHPIRDKALTVCPSCGKPVKRLISRTFISTPTGVSKLKNMGFTRLEKRDTGVYENVTATGSESRYWHADKPDTMPDIKRKISD
jgi:putative FmdB family regulatory protein